MYLRLPHCVCIINKYTIVNKYIFFINISACQHFCSEENTKQNPYK